MILAAGMGTRLRPLTDDRPKALVEIAGRTMLEITLSRLRASGVREVIINVHYLADMIIAYLKANDNFGMRIEVSREEVLLDTGGGLEKGRLFFPGGFGQAPKSRSFCTNVDVRSTIDSRAHGAISRRTSGSGRTLAVRDRETSRYLLFDEQLQLCGRQSGSERKTEWARPPRQAQALAFSGIHVISPRLLGMMSEEGVFSIITSYLRLAACGRKTFWPFDPMNIIGAIWAGRKTCSKPRRMQKNCNLRWRGFPICNSGVKGVEDMRCWYPYRLVTFC